jgi:hypothetical protein
MTSFPTSCAIVHLNAPLQCHVIRHTPARVPRIFICNGFWLSLDSAPFPRASRLSWRTDLRSTDRTAGLGANAGQAFKFACGRGKTVASQAACFIGARTGVRTVGWPITDRSPALVGPLAWSIARGHAGRGCENASEEASVGQCRLPPCPAIAVGRAVGRADGNAVRYRDACQAGRQRWQQHWFQWRTSNAGSFNQVTVSPDDAATTPPGTPRPSATRRSPAGVEPASCRDAARTTQRTAPRFINVDFPTAHAPTSRPRTTPAPRPPTRVGRHGSY